MEKSLKKRDVIAILAHEIPNLFDYYSEREVAEMFEGAIVAPGDDLAALFMEMVRDAPIRRCSNCGNLMVEGYLLDSQYACSDRCRNALYDPDDAENARKLYLIDCYEIDPEEVADLSADEIEEKYRGCTISDNVMYTEWC